MTAHTSPREHDCSYRRRRIPRPRPLQESGGRPITWRTPCRIPRATRCSRLRSGVLPPPGVVEVLSEDGGAFALRIVEQRGRAPARLRAHGTHVRKELHLLARVTDAQRGRYEVEFEVDEAFFHRAAERWCTPPYSGVQPPQDAPGAPRASRSPSAPTPASSSAARCPATRDARRAAWSTSRRPGSAFTSRSAARHRRHARDRSDPHRPGRSIHIETRVVRVDPAPYGRVRTGCEITELADDDRG